MSLLESELDQIEALLASSESILFELHQHVTKHRIKTPAIIYQRFAVLNDQIQSSVKIFREKMQPSFSGFLKGSMVTNQQAFSHSLASPQTSGPPCTLITTSTMLSCSSTSGSLSVAVQSTSDTAGKSTGGLHPPSHSSPLVILERPPGSSSSVGSSVSAHEQPNPGSPKEPKLTARRSLPSVREELGTAEPSAEESEREELHKVESTDQQDAFLLLSLRSSTPASQASRGPALARILATDTNKGERRKSLEIARPKLVPKAKRRMKRTEKQQVEPEEEKVDREEKGE